MIVITDSSIIVSALLRPAGTISQIFKSKSRLQFLAPDFLLTEINNHIKEIEENSTLSKKEVQNELNFLKQRIRFTAIDDIPQKYILQAYEIVKDIDVDDTFFVALNRYKHHKIWTLDRELITGLLKKGYNIFVTTAEIKAHLYKKNG